MLKRWVFNTLRPRQNGHHFADDIFKRPFLNENVWISIKSSLKFVLQGRNNNIPALVLIIAWRRQGDKPLSGPIMVRSLTHMCVTRPQWVNHANSRNSYFRNYSHATARYGFTLILWLHSRCRDMQLGHGWVIAFHRGGCMDRNDELFVRSWLC